MTDNRRLAESKFPGDFLACLNALERLDTFLAPIGLAGVREFEELRSRIVRHGAETYRDITRDVDEAPF